MKSSIVTLVLILVATPFAAADELQQELLTLDKRLWTAWGQGKGEIFKKILTEDHVQIIAGIGRVDGREAIAAEVSAGGCELRSFEFHDAQLRRLAPDVVVLSYVATQDASCGEDKLPPKIYCTSIYVRQDGAWLSASYQETPID